MNIINGNGNDEGLALPEKQGARDYEIGHGRPPKHTQFKPGQSGNPGGVARGTVFLSEIYKRLGALPPDVFDAYQPKNIAEEIGIEIIQRARGKHDKEDALSAAREIADRTEGRARQTVAATVTTESSQSRRDAVLSLANELAEKHGVTPKQVVDRLLVLRPELKQWMD